MHGVSRGHDGMVGLQRDLQGLSHGRQAPGTKCPGREWAGPGCACRSRVHRMQMTGRMRRAGLESHWGLEPDAITSAASSEPPRLSPRLQPLKGWEHEHQEAVLTRGTVAGIRSRIESPLESGL